MQCGFHTTRAAANLYAHRNTVERRVSRANELSAVKVEDTRPMWRQRSCSWTSRLTSGRVASRGKLRHGSSSKADFHRGRAVTDAATLPTL
ncbi:helix-turn-helix domain-containing protein [Streptomyces flavidovirens]|uniref:helix-turn-helix domain-containing protein n=1 Tax=Streptomyces flavidovirens TaxID=67298 RepID=UPI0036A2A2B3